MTALIHQFFGPESFLKGYVKNLEKLGTPYAEKHPKSFSGNARAAVKIPYLPNEQNYKAPKLAINAATLATSIKYFFGMDTVEKNDYFKSKPSETLKTYLSKITRDLFQTITMNGTKIMDQSFGQVETIKGNLKALIDLISENITRSRTAVEMNLKELHDGIKNWQTWYPGIDTGKIHNFSQLLEKSLVKIFENAMGPKEKPGVKDSRNAIKQINNQINKLISQILKPERINSV